MKINLGSFYSFGFVMENKKIMKRVHYVTIDSLPKEKKKELKEIMKKGIELYNDTTKHIEKGVTK